MSALAEQEGGATAPPLVVIELSGQPHGKRSMQHRIIARPGRPAFVVGCPHPKTKDYEARLRAAAEIAMNGRAVFDCAIICRVCAYMTIPVSWSKRQRAMAIAGQIRPTSKPDADNIHKTVDALKGIVWRDDALVVSAHVDKFYSLHPAMMIEVRPWRFGDND